MSKNQYAVVSFSLALWVSRLHLFFSLARILNFTSISLPILGSPVHRVRSSTVKPAANPDRASRQPRPCPQLSHVEFWIAIVCETKVNLTCAWFSRRSAGCLLYCSFVFASFLFRPPPTSLDDCHRSSFILLLLHRSFVFYVSSLLVHPFVTFLLFMSPAFANVIQNII